MNKLRFIGFLLTVSFVYFSINYFVFVRISNGLGLSSLVRNSLKVFFAIAALSFFVDRILGRYLLFDPFAFFVAYFGSVWLGIISIAFNIFLFQYVLVLIFPNQAKSITVISIIMVFLVSCFSIYIGLRPPKIKELKIPIEGLSRDLAGFLMIQLSDLHLQKWKSEKWLSVVVEKTNKLRPDLVVITGDLIEDDIKSCEKFIEILKQIDSKLGVLAIPGNHEFYSGIENFLKFAKEADITVLRNENITIANGIEIIGIDDKAGRMMTGTGADLKSATEDCDFNKPVILLSHRPTNFEESTNTGVDLQLSGHTHAGQIPPMDLIVLGVYKYPYGLYKHESAFIYTTCGTGTWGPPMRLFSRSEIVKIVLMPNKGSLDRMQFSINKNFQVSPEKS
jgi:predicted MPP superfamily phosphohydrolase